MLNLIKRSLLWLQIYALDILIAGQTEAIAAVSDPHQQLNIEHARDIACDERTRLRVEFSATFPAGVRCVWSNA